MQRDHAGHILCIHTSNNVSCNLYNMAIYHHHMAINHRAVGAHIPRKTCSDSPRLVPIRFER